MIPGTATLTPGDAEFVRAIITDMECQLRELRVLLSGNYAAFGNHDSLPCVAVAIGFGGGNEGDAYRPLAGQSWSRASINSRQTETISKLVSRDAAFFPAAVCDEPETGSVTLGAEQYLDAIVREMRTGTYPGFRRFCTQKEDSDGDE